MKFVRRIVLYIVGLLFLAFGVAFSVNSRLGVSPVNALPYVASLVLKKEMGFCVVMVFSVYMAIQLLILGREFHWINLSQILFAAVFGYFVDLAKWVVGDFYLPTYAGQLTMMGASILLVAVGVCLYLGVKLVPMPMEGMTHAVSKKLCRRLPFHDVKVMMDCFAVTLGIGLSLLCLGRLEGIREGTILCALLVGKVMKPLQKTLIPAVNRFCFESLQPEQ